MTDLDFGQRLLQTRETSRNYPSCIFILTGYGGLLLLTSLLIIQLQLPDSLLYFFLIPCVLGAFFFRRRLYLAMQGLLVAAAVWVTSRVSADFQTSLITISTNALIFFFITEILHRLVERHAALSNSLQESTQRYQSLFEESPIGIEIFDSGGRLIQLNQACRQIFGIPGDTDVSGFQLFTDPNLPREAAALLKAGQPARYEGVFDFDHVKEADLYPTEKSGKIHLDVRITPLALDTEGTAEGYLAQILDITEQKRSQQILQAREALYSSVTENANDSILIVQDARLKYFNPQLIELTGYSQDQLRDHPFASFIAPEHRDQVSSYYRRRQAGEGLPDRYDTVVLHAEGKRIPVELNVSLISYQDQPATLVILHDISAQKETQEKLQRYAHQQSLLNDLAKAAMETSTLEQAQQALADPLAELLEADRCWIILFDRSRKENSFSSRQEGEFGQVEWDQIKAERPELLEAILADDDPYWVDEFPAVLNGETGTAQEGAAGALMGLPLIADGQTMGAAVLFFNGPRRISDEEMLVARQAARQTALALLKIHLTEEARERAVELLTLQQAGLTVASKLDLEESVDNILDQLNTVIPHDSASVQLLEEDELVIIGGRGWEDPDAVVGMRFPVPGDNPNSVVIETREPHIISDTRQAYQPFHDAPHSHIRSWLGVPLMVRDEIIGMLAVDSTKNNYFQEDHARLVAAFAHQVAVAIENARLYEEVKFLAKTDELTGVNNRRRIMELGQREYKRSIRYGYPLSVIMLDIDNFKEINDTCGHTVGDKVIQQLARGCLKNMRELDLVGRYGGDEFVLLLPDTELKDAVGVAERLRACVERSPHPLEKGELPFTISMGAAELIRDCESLEALLDLADEAMYQAKERGGNQVVSWSGK